MAGAPAKFPGGFVPAGPLPIGPAYGAVPMLPHIPYAARPPSQIVSIILTVIHPSYSSRDLFTKIIATSK